MGFSFTREEPVLNFGPRAHVLSHSSPQYLLWPAWAYRVVAPRVRERRLNMFQRATLGLCRANVVEAELIAEKLSIHRDLAAFILVELTDLAYLDKYGHPSQKGLRVLEDDSDEAHQMVAGFVFQDPWNGELWPRFVERLDYSELDYDDKEFPRLILGSKGSPRKQWAYMELPKEVPSPGQPSPASVIEAVHRHRKGLRYADPSSSGDDDDINGFTPSGMLIERVSFVEEKPAAVFLTTYLYLPNSSDEFAVWYVCDPFGLGASVRLRRRIEQVMRQKRPLYEIVNRFVGRVVHDGLEKQKCWVEQLRTSAALEVECRLTFKITPHDAFEQILNMEFARQEATLLGGNCPDSKLDVALRECSKVLEAVLGEIISRHPLGDVWKRVYVFRIDRHTGKKFLAQQQDKDLLVATYRSAALAVGFEEPVPDSLLNVSPGRIRSVAQFGQHGSLRPLVTATILAAQAEPGHPMRQAARRAPRLLLDLDDIANRGGKAGHANNEKVTINDIESTVDKTYKVIGALTGYGSVGGRVMDSVDGAIHG